MTAPAVKRPVVRPGGKGPQATETPVRKVAVSTKTEAPAKKASDNGKLSAEGLSCLCGCGQPTKTDKAKFIPGHDAKLKSLLLRLERGEAEKGERVPEIAKKFLQKSPLSGAWHFPTESGNTPDEDKHGGRTYAERREEIEAEKAEKKAARDAKLAELKASKAKTAKKTAKAAPAEEEEEEAEEEEE